MGLKVSINMRQFKQAVAETRPQVRQAIRQRYIEEAAKG